MDLPPQLTADLIAADIARAETPPGWFYRDPGLHREVIERVFATTWQWLGDDSLLPPAGGATALVLSPGGLDEPVLLSLAEGAEPSCLSNVCTHRGAVVCTTDRATGGLRCPYHGRRFGLDGGFRSMPGFEGAEGFPTTADDLPRLPLGRWHRFLFAAISPAFPFLDLVAELEARVGFLPIADARLDRGRSRQYRVAANWALYCDNYLEGLHVPYVHPSLSRALDLTAYRTEIFPWASLQVGTASPGDDAFDLPRDHPDHGQAIAAYYFWLYPNTMVNVYPWGLSINLVQPTAVDATRVHFLSYVWDEERLDRGAGSDLHTVELEDEAVVESVQRGLRSRLYRRGRYSPTHETAVHHFHRLLIRSLTR